MSENLDNQLTGILTLIAATGGVIKGRVRLQKMAYLLSEINFPYFNKRNFSYHYYGPYSRELSEYLQSSVGAGFIEEKKENYLPSQSVYEYILSDEGKQWLKEQGDIDVSAFQGAIDILNKRHWRDLELAATVVYLQEKEGFSSRNEAVSKALELKPECRPNETAAKQTLEELNI